jgi:hypothetical protein
MKAFSKMVGKGLGPEQRESVFMKAFSKMVGKGLGPEQRESVFINVKFV